jgi:hypothetical protein
MKDFPTDLELEDRVRGLLLAGDEGRGELNELLRRNEAARPIVARVLFEEAALISGLRMESARKWAENLGPRVVPGGGRREGRRWRRGKALLLAAAACLVGGVVVPRWERGDAGPGTVDGGTAPRSGIGVLSRFDATGRRIGPGSELLEDGDFELAGGRARIDLDNGVVLSVGGPAKIVIGLDRCRLWRGQVDVDVPDDVDTYIVETEQGRFVDLGTRFSVSVNPGERTEMAVRSGMVRAERISYEGDVVSSELVRQKEGVVLADSGSRFRRVPAGQLGHQGPISLGGGELEVPAAYRDATLAAGPLVLWGFDEDAGAVGFPNLAGPGFQGRPQGDFRVRSGAGGNRFVEFAEAGGGGWIDSADLWRKDSAAPFTIELWARPDRVQWGHLFNLRVEGDRDPVTGHAPLGPLSFFSMEMTSSRVFLPMPTAPSIRCTFRSPATEHPLQAAPGGVNVSLASPERYLPGKWHHLVARVKRDRCTLFVDGVPVADRDVVAPVLGRIELGLRLGSLLPRDGPDHRKFFGAIDEVAVYERALGDGEIASRFRMMAGPPP